MGESQSTRRALSASDRVANARRRSPQPCVRVTKTALYPIELCEIHPGQKFSKKLDPQQTADSLKLTTIGYVFPSRRPAED
jgi:hypothetical protein